MAKKVKYDDGKESKSMINYEDEGVVKMKKEWLGG